MQVGDSIVLEEEVDPNYEPTDAEIEEYARWLGFDMENDRDLLYLAREGLKAPLPPNWKPCKTTDTGEIYYFNFVSGESTWDHPCDDYYKKRYEDAKKKKRDVAKAARDEADERKKREKEQVRGILAAQTGSKADAAITPVARPSSGGAAASAPLAMPASSPTGGLAPLAAIGRPSSAGALAPVVVAPAAGAPLLKSNSTGSTAAGMSVKPLVAALPSLRPPALPDIGGDADSDEASAAQPVARSSAPRAWMSGGTAGGERLARQEDAADSGVRRSASERQMASDSKGGESRASSRGKTDRDSDVSLLQLASLGAAASAQRDPGQGRAGQRGPDDSRSGDHDPTPADAGFAQEYRRADAAVADGGRGRAAASADASRPTSRRSAQAEYPSDGEEPDDEDAPRMVLDLSLQHAAAASNPALMAGGDVARARSSAASADFAAEEAAARSLHAARLRKLQQENQQELSKIEAEHRARLAAARDAHERAMSSARREHEQALAAARGDHAAAMQRERAAFQTEHDAYVEASESDLRRARDEHAKALLDISSNHARDLRMERENAQVALEAARRDHETALRETKRKWQSEEEAAERAGREAVASVNAHYATVLQAVRSDPDADAEVQRLRAEAQAELAREREAAAAAQHSRAAAETARREAEAELAEQQRMINEERARLRGEREQLEQELGELRSAATRQRAEVEDEQRVLSAERARVEQQLAAIQDDAASLDAAVSTLHSRLDAVTERLGAFRNNVTAVVTGIGRDLQMIAGAAHVPDTGAFGADLHASQLALHAICIDAGKAATPTVSSVAARMDVTITTLAELARATEGIPAKVAAWSAHLADLAATAPSAMRTEAELEAARQAEATLAREINDLREKLQSAATETEAASTLRTRVTLLESQLAEQHSQAALLRSQHIRAMNDVRSELEAQRRSAEHAQLELAEKARAEEAASARLAEAERRVSSKAADVDALATQLATAQGTITALQQELAAASAAVSTPSSQAADEALQARIDLARARAAIASLESEAVVLRREQQQALERIAGLQAEMASVKREHAAAMTRVAQLQSQLSGYDAAAGWPAPVPAPVSESEVAKPKPQPTVIATEVAASAPVISKPEQVAAERPSRGEVSGGPAAPPTQPDRLQDELQRAVLMGAWLALRRSVAAAQREQLLKDRAQWKLDAQEVARGMNEHLAGDLGDASPLLMDRRALLKRIKRELDAAAERLNAFVLRVKASESWLSKRRKLLDRLEASHRRLATASTDAPERQPLQPSSILQAWRDRSAWQKPSTSDATASLDQVQIAHELARLQRELELYRDNMGGGPDLNTAAPSAIFEYMPPELTDDAFATHAAEQILRAAKYAAASAGDRTKPRAAGSRGAAALLSPSAESVSASSASLDTDIFAAAELPLQYGRQRSTRGVSAGAAGGRERISMSRARSSEAAPTHSDGFIAGPSLWQQPAGAPLPYPSAAPPPSVAMLPPSIPGMFPSMPVMYPWPGAAAFPTYPPMMAPPMYAAAEAPGARFARRSRRYVPSPGVFSPSDSEDGVPIRSSRHVPHRPHRDERASAGAAARDHGRPASVAQPIPAPTAGARDVPSASWDKWAAEAQDIQRRVAEHAEWLHAFRTKLGDDGAPKAPAGRSIPVERMADPLSPPRMFGFDPHPTALQDNATAFNRVRWARPLAAARRQPRSRSASPSDFNMSTTVSALVSPLPPSRRERLYGASRVSATP